MAGPDQSRPVPYGGVPDPNQPGQAVSRPVGQYPPAAGQQAAAPNSSPGYGYSPAYRSSRPPRRRHTGIIVLVVVLVAVRVLVVITVVGILIWFWVKSDRHEVGASASAGTNVADSGDRWSSDWLNGVEEAWTLDAPAGLGGDASITIMGDKLIRMLSGPDAATVTVYRLGDGAPEQLWEEEVSGSASWITVWKNRIVYAGRQSHAVNLYEADGSTRETFESGVDEQFTTYPWTPVPFTLDQARLWLKDGDVSWAPSTYSVSQADASCNSITVGDNDIDLGKENALTKGKSGSCYGTSPIQAVYHSGDGQIATFYEHNDSNEEFLHLVDMIAGQSPDPIALGDRSSFSVQGDLLIAYDRAGNATAYRPA